jgi:F-type H+-transporting ATPase subunit gamma
MPSLIDLRRRIRAVKSTQQITKAMKMIAASRLRRAHDRVVNARPFAADMLRVLNDVAARVEPDVHPLLDQRPEGGKILFVVITADRGLCGSFNSNIIKNAGQFIMSHDPGAIALGLVGRKGRDFFARRGFEVKFEHVNIFQRVNYNDAQAIARAAMEDFTSHAMDQVYLIYNEFKSVLSQRVVIERLLPIPRLDESAGGDVHDPDEESDSSRVDFLYEPGPERIFEELLPHHVEIQVWRALLESNAAFFAAQMTAMDTATKNSAEMIDQLTLYMNKLRQAAITREIIEVVSGAQAL